MPTGSYTTADIDQTADPLDFTDRYNTMLPASMLWDYIKWARLIGQDPVKGRYDYDLQGAFMNRVQADARGHLTDRYKKPNHPTFSDQSMYNGMDGYTGGSWTDAGYRPSQTNLTFRTPDQLKSYFLRVEPDTPLLLTPSETPDLAAQ
jgi:hypothetical protein